MLASLNNNSEFNNFVGTFTDPKARSEYAHLVVSYALHTNQPIPGAVDDFMKSMYSSNGVTNVGNSNIRIPSQVQTENGTIGLNADHIQSVLKNIKSNFMQNAYLPSADTPQGAAARNLLLNFIRNGHWVTMNNDQGAYLVSSTGVPVMTKASNGQKNLTIMYADAMNMRAYTPADLFRMSM